MPAQDGTGPQGMGPATGRGLGPCGMGVFGRRGFGKGPLEGRGLCRYFGFNNWPQDPKAQKQNLEDYKKSLQEELEDVDKELSQTK